MITASHNPAKYNGYKVYGSDGGQITTETANSILNEINNIDPFSDVKYMDFDAALSQKLIVYIEEKTVTAYIEAVSTQALCGDEINKNISVIYTPLNGSGLHCVMRTLKGEWIYQYRCCKGTGTARWQFPHLSLPQS